jgi:hypothetical protein
MGIAIGWYVSKLHFKTFRYKRLTYLFPLDFFFRSGPESDGIFIKKKGLGLGFRVPRHFS